MLDHHFSSKAPVKKEFEKLSWERVEITLKLDCEGHKGFNGTSKLGPNYIPKVEIVDYSHFEVR